MNYNSPTGEEAVGYMRLPLRVIDVHGEIPKTILDVGAAHGHFSDFISTVWPDAKITAVECNDKDHYFLDSKPYDVRFACVGKEKGTATFYTDKADEVGGGSSFYKELTPAFDGAVEETKEITTLDTLFPKETFDLIKIDTQGSEKDVMFGGRKLLSRAKYLLLELSFVEYNEGAPLIDEMLAYTRLNDWKLIATFGPDLGVHRWGSQAIQVDALFARSDQPNLFRFQGK